MNNTSTPATAGTQAAHVSGAPQCPKCGKSGVFQSARVFGSGQESLILFEPAATYTRREDSKYDFAAKTVIIEHRCALSTEQPEITPDVKALVDRGNKVARQEDPDEAEWRHVMERLCNALGTESRPSSTAASQVEQTDYAGIADELELQTHRLCSDFDYDVALRAADALRLAAQNSPGPSSTAGAEQAGKLEAGYFEGVADALLRELILNCPPRFQSGMRAIKDAEKALRLAASQQSLGAAPGLVAELEGLMEEQRIGGCEACASSIELILSRHRSEGPAGKEIS